MLGKYNIPLRRNYGYLSGKYFVPLFESLGCLSVLSSLLLFYKIQIWKICYRIIKSSLIKLFSSDCSAFLYWPFLFFFIIFHFTSIAFCLTVVNLCLTSVLIPCLFLFLKSAEFFNKTNTLRWCNKMRSVDLGRHSRHLQVVWDSQLPSLLERKDFIWLRRELLCGMV